MNEESDGGVGDIQQESPEPVSPLEFGEYHATHEETPKAIFEIEKKCRWKRKCHINLGRGNEDSGWWYSAIIPVACEPSGI